ncbi:MAG: acyl-CoA thioesterase [Pseudomonadales bacterium]
MTEMDTAPSPAGELTMQTVAMPKDTNASGDIFGGWLVSQMDLAAMVAAQRVAKGRVATVAIDEMNFMVPVKVGAVVSCFADISSVGRSSIHVQVEVWIANQGSTELNKVTEGMFVFVAIDDNGRTRAIAS